MSGLIEEAYDMSPDKFRKYYHSNSSILSKPQQADYTFLASEKKKILSMTPLPSILLVEMIPNTNISELLHTDFKNNVRMKTAKILKIGRNMKLDIWKEGMVIYLPSRTGFQLEYYGSDVIHRLVLEKNVLACRVS